MRLWTRVAAFSALIFLFVLGIFLLTVFPIVLFPKLVKSQLHLRTKHDGQFPTITYYWSKLPATNYYDFYFFNVTNYDEVLFNAEVPHVIEVGPYSYLESEFKEAFEWSDDGKTVFFKNNKTWTYQPETSCATCSYDDILALPNAAYMTVAQMIVAPAGGGSSSLSSLLDILLMLLGEYPVRTVPMKGVLFESYPDPLIDLLNSQLAQTLFKIVPPETLGLSIPPVKAMGYFPLYNHTNDENYTIFTGKDDVYLTGAIKQWGGNALLPWWTHNASNLTGIGDGSFNKPDLKKSDLISQYQSFSCRSFQMNYEMEEKVRGIKSYLFKVRNDSYDANLPRNIGYRYENPERKNYFPSWPCNGTSTYNPTSNCNEIDCNIMENYCSRCCNGSYVNGTYLLPPGIVPLRCLPGKITRMPFAAFLSPPHFVESPDHVTKSIVGLAPDSSKHDTGLFNIQPLVGTTVKAVFRMQLSIPIYNDDHLTMIRNLNSAFMPSFWVEVRANLKNYAIDYIKMNTVILPSIILGVGIALTALSIVIFVVFLFFTMRKRQPSYVTEKYTYDENGKAQPVAANGVNGVQKGAWE